jgi:HAD superfamily hydrolase (TIGR01509 family)
MLKAILFDLDDTLLDWRGFQEDWPRFEERLLRHVFNYICREIVELPDFPAFVIEFRNRIRDAWSAGRGNLIAPNLGNILVETVEKLGAAPGTVTARQCLQAYDWKAVPGTALFPEVLETLTLIRQHGIKTGIVTNASQPMWIRDIEIEGHGLLKHFPECRISAADVGYLKPHPAIFQTALTQLSVEPAETVFVGDNPIADIAGAQGVGLRAVLRVTHPAPPMLSGLIVPDGAVNSLYELLGLLDEWYPGWRD